MGIFKFIGNAIILAATIKVGNSIIEKSLIVAATAIDATKQKVEEKIRRTQNT